MTADRLDPSARASAVTRLRATTPEEPLDVLVVGGGVVGAGAALDAAVRGLSVGLVEARDLASGTSSRSSRLAHGGLRYLEQREFALVHEALTERGLLLDRIAPHLVRPVPFLYPVTHRGWERPYVGAGIHLYDLLSRVGAYGGTMPRPRSLSRAAVANVAPGLRAEALTGAVRFHDAQIDDARHVVALARTAAGRGAAVVAGARVVDLLRGAPGEDGQRRVTGAVVEDDGVRFDVYARVVLGAAGVWTDQLRAMAGAGDGATQVRQSKGVHLVVPSTAIRSSMALIARTPVSVLFLLPWGRQWLVGTTDTDFDGDLAEPGVDVDDVDYLIGQANRWLARPLTRADVLGVYAGIRPLLAGADDSTTTLSREHSVLHPAPGMVCVAGGKYTTYRVMAADVVDAAVAERAALVDDEVPACTTDEVPVVGAEGYREAWAARMHLARASGLPVATVEHLLRRHGDRVDDVLELLVSDRSLGEPLHPDTDYLRAEAVVAVTHEGARTLGDVLLRRTRAGLETPDGATGVAREVAALVAGPLGWDAGRVDAEVAAYAASRPVLPAGEPAAQEAAPALG